MSGTKNQHYVAQGYLKNFTDNEGLLDTYNFKTLKYEKFGTSVVCSHKYTYELPSQNGKPRERYNELEKLMGKYENKAIPIINKIIKQMECILTSKVYLEINEKIILSKYCILQFLRTDRGRIMSVRTDAGKFFTSNEIQEINASNMKIFREELFLFNQRYIDESSLELLIMRFMVITNIDFTYMRCCIKNRHFITSDFPSYFMQTNYNGDKVLILPLNPKLAIMFPLRTSTYNLIHQHRGKTEYIIKTQVMDDLNETCIQNSIYWIISNKFNKNDKKMIKKRKNVIKQNRDIISVN